MEHSFIDLHDVSACSVASKPTLLSACHVVYRYGLAALRAECLRVLCATTTIETVSTHVLLAFEQQCTELMQVRALTTIRGILQAASSCLYTCLMLFSLTTYQCEIFTCPPNT